MNTPSIQRSTLKSVTARLTLGQKVHAFGARMFFAFLMANILLHTQTLLYLLPVFFPPIVALIGAKKGELWHGLVLPQGYQVLPKAGRRSVYIAAAVWGMLFSILLFILLHVLNVKYFGLYLVIIGGSIALAMTFFNIGLVRGWDAVAAPSNGMNPGSLLHVKAPRFEKLATGFQLLLVIGLTMSIASFKNVVDAADAAQAAQVEQQVAQEAQEQEAAPASSPYDASDEEVTTAAAISTPVAAPAPVSTLPADDSAEITAMLDRAHRAAATSDQEAIDEQYIDPSTSVPLWANAARKDGYPAYAAACDITAKAICRQYNGMGNGIDVPIASVVDSLTVVRNADIASGKYLCGQGVCIDQRANLVGRVSAAMAQAHPELSQAYGR